MRRWALSQDAESGFGYGVGRVTDPAYDEDLGAFVIEGRDAGPAGALVVSFSDGSVISLDRLDPTRPIDVLLCGAPSRLGPDATVLAAYLFDGQWPERRELLELPAWQGEAAVRARALGRAGLALSRGAGRESLWWAEAVHALRSWGSASTGRPPPIWCTGGASGQWARSRRWSRSCPRQSWRPPRAWARSSP